MRIDLDDLQLAGDDRQGRITGADGKAYGRQGTKAKRAVADELIAAGAPLVLESFGAGQFEWFDGEDATEEWSRVRPYVISTAPTSKQLAKHAWWNAGVWETADGSRLLHLSGHC